MDNTTNHSLSPLVTPGNYFTRTTQVLEDWIAWADTVASDEDVDIWLYDRVTGELDMRAISDDRVAQAAGCGRGWEVAS